MEVNLPATFLSLNSKELDAKNTLKAALTAPPIFGLPYAGGHLDLDIDAFNVRVGCILLQKQPDDMTEPIGY